VLPDYLAMKIIHARATDKDALVAVSVPHRTRARARSLSVSCRMYVCMSLSRFHRKERPQV
jgi:hypothetical protein